MLIANTQQLVGKVGCGHWTERSEGSVNFVLQSERTIFTDSAFAWP